MLQGKPLLLIWGVHQDSEGYPNTRYRLKFLHDLQEFEVREIAAPILMPDWKRKHRTLGIVYAVAIFINAHFRIFWRYMSLRKTPHVLYIPYPAIFALTMLYMVPQRLRPRKIIADAFISIYDTLVKDRKKLKPCSVPARILHTLEQRAYRQADHIVVDTEQNADFLKSEFDLSVTKVTAIPLSTNEVDYSSTPYLPRTGCRILFIGTMIPLHGISTILSAAKLLEKESTTRFRLIGSGQESYKIREAIECGASNLEWEENWLSPKELAMEIAQADICLGIFDSGDKAQRVCPYKLYAYCSVGRTIITANTSWMHNATSHLDYEPFVIINANDPTMLAETIKNLLLHPEARKVYAANARKFYQDHLCNALSHHQLKALLI